MIGRLRFGLDLGERREVEVEVRERGGRRRRGGHRRNAANLRDLNLISSNRSGEDETAQTSGRPWLGAKREETAGRRTNDEGKVFP